MAPPGQAWRACLLSLATATSVGTDADARIADVRLSPDGSRVVAIQTTGRDRVAVVADLASGRRAVAASSFRPSARLDTCDWVSNERLVCSLFVFRRKGIFGEERSRLVRLFAVDHDGANPLPLLDSPLRPPPKAGGVGPNGITSPGADLEHALVSRLPGAPGFVLVSACRQAKPYTSVYRVDVRDGSAVLEVGWQAGIQHWHADWQGRVRIGTGAYAFGSDVPWWNFAEPPRAPTAVARRPVRPTQERTKNQRLNTERLSSPIGPTETTGPRVLGFSLDGRSVYYVARVDAADRASVWQADGATLEPVQELVTDPDRDVVAAAIGGERCGTVGFAHRNGIAWLDPALARTVATAANEVGAEVVHVPSMSADCRRLVLASTDHATELRYHLLDRDTGALRNLGGHRARGGGSARTVRRTDRFTARDGLQLPVALTMPDRAERDRPVVVLLDYDGSWTADPAVLDDWPHVLASRGYVVAQPAYRGAQGYAPALHLAGLGQRGSKIGEDVTDAVAWLASQGLGDPQRVCFAGRGRGGHMAMAAALGYAPPDPARAQRCVAVLAALEVRHTKRGPHNALDSRVCSDFPCGDWMRWAAPDAMRLAAMRVSAAKPAKDTDLRSPVVDAAHPGFPVLVHYDGQGTVHERGSARFRSDLRKVSFFEHVAFAGGEAGAAFLADAEALFDEALASGGTVVDGASHADASYPSRRSP